MNYEHSFFQLILLLAAACIVPYGIIRWRNLRGETSVFSQSDGIKEIGKSALSSLFNPVPTDLGNGRTELRPTWGIRLSAPLIAVLFLVITNLDPLWGTIGMGSGWIRQAIFAAFAMTLGYALFMMLFVQRIIYDDHYIASYGINMRTETRALRDLVDIRTHAQRPALVLTFSDQKQLYVPRFLSHRDIFITAMQEISNHNGNNGMIAPMAAWQARLRDDSRSH